MSRESIQRTLSADDDTLYQAIARATYALALRNGRPFRKEIDHLYDRLVKLRVEGKLEEMFQRYDEVWSAMNDEFDEPAEPSLREQKKERALARRNT